MRVRDFQEILGKFTNDANGTIISIVLFTETMMETKDEENRIQESIG